MKMRGALALALVLFMLGLAACGGGKPAATKSTPAAPKESAATQKSSQAAEVEEAPTAEAETAGEVMPGEEATPSVVTEEEAEPAPTAAASSDESLSLASRATGLDQLKSYRMRWQSEWGATSGGKADKASWDWVEEYSSDPKALHWVWNAAETSATGKNSGMELWQIGDTAYMATKEADGNTGCMSFSSEDQKDQFTKGIFSPNSLGSVSNARYVGNETVNGIAAKHYKYDEKGASLAGLGKVSGDMWVASDGGYVVKDAMTWQGAAGFFGSDLNESGEGKWTWELSDVNQPVEIKAPENCGGAAKDLPMMADATEKNSFGDTILYKTAAKVADVVAFYEKEMPAAGWQAGEGGPQVSDELGMLNYAKGDQKVQVMVTTDNDQTQVMLTVTK